MQKTYNFAEKIRERVWMLWWQIKSDIREGIVQQWKRFAMLGIIYAVCVIYFIMIYNRFNRKEHSNEKNK